MTYPTPTTSATPNPPSAAEPQALGEQARPTTGPPAPQVVVRGEAVLVVDPEIADVAVAVSTRARDRQTALDRCRSRQQEVAAVVAAAGDAVENVETTGVSVAEDPRRPAGREPSAVVHTRLTLTRPELAGELVASLGRLDDVAVAGVTWRLRPGSPVHERARLAAVQDAVHRARQYAAAFGARLTALVEVRDAGGSDGGLPAFPAMAATTAFEEGAAGPDLTPAPQHVHGSVEVRFAMSAPDPAIFSG